MIKCEVSFLNKPSKQAIYNFHRVFYDIFKDFLEGRCTMEEFIAAKDTRVFKR